MVLPLAKEVTVRRLSPESFRRAGQFLKTKARPLDRARFEHRFEAAPADAVIEELAPYQNADGGFGHALEPDVRTPSSSALATGIALGMLKELGQPADHPMVSGGIAFLFRSFDAEAAVGRVIPRDADDHPHAPWWHDEDGSLARTFDDFLIIPRAQLVALLHHYTELVPNDWLDSVTEATASAIETLDEEAFAGGGDTLRYALELAGCDALSRRLRGRLMQRLRDLCDRLVCRDPSQWEGYCATPLKIAPSPDSPVIDLLWEDVRRNLDYAVERQTEEGTWEPTWTWGERYPTAWEQAKTEWRGHVTLETLTSLHAFGRLAL